MLSDMSLSDLPAEIIIDIFKSFDVVGSATALSQTSRKFHTVWRTNIVSICREVLPRGVEYYDQANKVFEEMKQSILGDGQANASILRVDRRVIKTTIPSRVLLSIAESTFVALIEFEFEFEDGDLAGLSDHCSCIRTGPDGQYHCPFTPSGLSRYYHFLQSFYHTMSVMHLAAKTTQEIRQTLSPVQLLDFFQMSEAMIRVLKSSARHPWSRFDCLVFSNQGSPNWKKSQHGSELFITRQVRTMTSIAVED